MSLNDYNASASSNTSISGINIAPNCPRENIDNAIRQIMADLAALPSYTVTPTGEGAADSLADLLRSFPTGPRDPVIYNAAQSVRFSKNYMTSGRFRFRGQYTGGRGAVVAMPSSKVASMSTGLGAESAAKENSWYAAFACADNGDATAVIKVMPFLRAGTVAGSNVPLIEAGENVHALTAATYAWTANDNLIGAECLVISEAGAWSGRVTTVTANVAGQITLASIGTIAANDYLLIAPPGYDLFEYLGSFYYETGAPDEVRNIYDSGTLVKAKMINITTDEGGSTGFLAGSEASPVLINARGYISPLATAIVIGTSSTLSTTSAGDYAEYFAGDTGNHNVDERYTYRSGSEATKVVVFGNIQIPFLYHQSFAYSNAGSLAVNRTTATMPVWGWIEP